MEFLKFLHVFATILAITLFVGPELLIRVVILSGNVPAIRAVLAGQRRLDPFAIIAFVVGIGAGIATALLQGWSLWEPWLVIAYVLAVAVVLLGVLVYTPKARRLERLAEESPVEGPSAKLLAAMRSPANNLALVASLAVWTALILDMVLKPFV
jgi:hypothetical protein